MRNGSGSVEEKDRNADAETEAMLEEMDIWKERKERTLFIFFNTAINFFHGIC